MSFEEISDLDSMWQVTIEALEAIDEAGTPDEIKHASDLTTRIITAHDALVARVASQRKFRTEFTDHDILTLLPGEIEFDFFEVQAEAQKLVAAVITRLIENRR